MEKPGLKDETGAPETQPCDAKDTKSSHERVDSALNTKDLNSLCDQDRKIIQQLEFYFSDSNFRRDNFLKAKAAEDKDGFVAVETLLTFNRLKTLCTDSMKISNIAAYSSKLVVSNDKKSIRRAAPLPEIDNSRFRTIFASKIPIETSLDTLLSIFSDKGSLDVAGVRMRRDKETKSFNGSAFVEYNTENDFKEAKSTSFEFEGSKFEILSLVDFLKKKRRESKVQEENRKRSHTSENISTPEFEKGTILYLEGISPDGVDRESIKSLFSNYGDVGFVDFSRGDVDGHVRMANADSASKVINGKLSNKEEFLLGGQSFDCKLLDDDCEKEYMEKVQRARISRRLRSNKRNRH